MGPFLSSFKSLPIFEAAGWFFVANAGIFLSSVIGCWCFGKWFSKRRIFDRWEAFSRVELGAALLSVVLNSLVSVAGWWLWKLGWIELREKKAFSVLFDSGLMLLAMDLGMYGLHRLAHHPRLYPWFHRFHHRHEVTNPISLFVLHPLEVLGFGGLMIAFLLVYPISPLALMIYLFLNVAFGTLGHSGVEPFPRVLKRIPLVNLVGTSTFHAEHHERPRFNFGFYTLLWDQCFGTLDPEYWRRYERAAKGRSDEPES